MASQQENSAVSSFPDGAAGVWSTVSDGESLPVLTCNGIFVSDIPEVHSCLQASAGHLRQPQYLQPGGMPTIVMDTHVAGNEVVGRTMVDVDELLRIAVCQREP